MPACPEASEPGQAAGGGRGFRSLTLAAPQDDAAHSELFVCWEMEGRGESPLLYGAYRTRWKKRWKGRIEVLLTVAVCDKCLEVKGSDLLSIQSLQPGSGLVRAGVSHRATADSVPWQHSLLSRHRLESSYSTADISEWKPVPCLGWEEPGVAGGWLVFLPVGCFFGLLRTKFISPRIRHSLLLEHGSSLSVLYG